MSEDLSWRFKLSNWISGGALEKYKQQAQSVRAQLQQTESEIETLNNQTAQLQRELAQAKAQLQINQGFQIELGETQLELQKTQTEFNSCKLQLIAAKKALSQSQVQLQQASKTLAKSDWLQQVKNPIEVVDIQKILSKKDFDNLWGFGLATPEVKTTATAGAITIKGWVLAKKTKVKILRITHQETTLLEIPVDLPSPIITQQYPDIPKAGNSGFETILTVAGISSKTELILNVVLENNSVIPLCAIFLQAQ
jgi:multidrug efflux pump subunit AcrA (membrane-fusion protein)